MPRSPRPATAPQANTRQPDVTPPDAAQADTARTAAKAVRRSRARERVAYNAAHDVGVDELALHAAIAGADFGAPSEGPRVRARAAATSDTGRWVPIGPSVIRRGQAMDRPHVTGRIRDLAVSPDGTRAYAASARGGLWYSQDGGSSWAPVGAWIGGHRRAGGINSVFVCGALLVHFGATQAADFVMVGTGELSPWFTASGEGSIGGIGVLSARGPAFASETANPWEPDTGLGQLEGLGIYRLVRRPGRTAGDASAAAPDEVLAATSAGLFRGVRAALPPAIASPPFPALPARDGFTWTAVPGIPTWETVTDVLWIPHGGGTRMLVLINGEGLEFSDDDGATFIPVPTLHRPAVRVRGRSSIAVAAGDRAYVLHDRGTRPAVARIPDLTATPPVATNLTGVPTVWTTEEARDYDQAIAAEVVSGTDRLYLGGNTVMPVATGEWSASLWAMDVHGTALRPRPGISDRGAHPAAGADRAGLVGNNVHADVHAIVLPGAPTASRPVWIACDGGVYVSAESGRVNTFAAVNTGLAVAETGFIDSHPVASHLVASGLQDNGTSVRTGDTVWEAVHLGDGGGVAFAPTAPDTLVAQYIYGWWASSDRTFRDPLTRSAGGPSGAINTHPEFSSTRALFYSACAAVRRPGVPPAADSTRLALGTDRVWLSDTVGSGGPSRWVVLPIVPSTAPPGTTAAARDPHPNATTASRRFGVVTTAGLGLVVSVAWVSPTELLVLYERGILRQTETAAGIWRTDWLYDPATPPFPVSTGFTEIAAVPGSQHFYVTTAGLPGVADPDTAYFFNATTSTFHATGLRTELNFMPGVLGPLDPAYSAVVDPGQTTEVYVGTKTGVWRGTRTSDATGAHSWTHFANGLPEATVQDLSIWAPAAGGGPRLLRAAIQSRGVFETDLAAPTPVVTYVRCHEFDDRRGPLPQRSPRASATALSTVGSPDIVVRPEWPVPAAPAFPQVVAGTPDAALVASNAGRFNTWTFQTAFRWWYPSVRADGNWTDAFGDLIERDRRVRGMPRARSINKALWEAVVGGTRLRTTGAGVVERSTDPGDPLAVFRPPWHTALAGDARASEVDIMECVVPPTSFGGSWVVSAVPSVVEVLLHHRGFTPLLPDQSSVTLLWKPVTFAMSPGPLHEPAGQFVDFWRLTTTRTMSAVPPTGWNVVGGGADGVVHSVGQPLATRLPRAASIPLDLSALAGSFIVLVAFAGSTTAGLQPVTGSPATLDQLAQTWPHIATRLIQVA